MKMFTPFSMAYLKCTQRKAGGGQNNDAIFIDAVDSVFESPNR